MLSLKGVFNTAKEIANTARAAIKNPSKKMVWGGSALLATSTALTAPGLALPATIALGIGSIYLMHHSSEYAMGDLEKFGTAKGISPISLGILAGMIHTANEFLVSMFALGNDAPDLAISNVVGGSIAHTLMILGGAAAIAGIGKGVGLGWKFNTAVMTAATAAFGGQLLYGEFNPVLGLAMLGSGLYYLRQRTKGGETCAHDHQHGASCGCGHSHDHNHHALTPVKAGLSAPFGVAAPSTGPLKIKTINPKHSSPWFNAASAAASLAALIAVCDIFVDQIMEFAQHYELSNTLTGLTLAAIGTALPEAIMTIKAALKKNGGFALGNVMGCNITNTLVVGGIIAALGGLGAMDINIPENLRPDTLEGMINWGMFMGATGLTTAALFANDGQIKRWQGAIGLGLYGAYLATMTQISEKSAPLIHEHARLEAPDPIEIIVEERPPINTEFIISGKNSYPHNAL